MTDFVNPEDNSPVPQPDPGIAEQQFNQGQIGIPADAEASLVSPDDNKAYKVPAEQVPGFINEGWSFETKDQEALRGVRIDIAQHPWSSMAKTFSGQAANQFLLGIPEPIADRVQGENSLAVKTRKVYEEENPASNMFGGISGFAAGILWNPLLRGLGKAGEAAAETASNLLKTVGPDAAKSYVGKFLQATVPDAVSGGVQGALVRAPEALTEFALGDPNKTGEGLNAALSTELGGVVGGAGVNLGIKAFTSPIAAALKLAGDVITPESLRTKGQSFDLKGLDFLKPNISKIAAEDPSLTATDNIKNYLGRMDESGLLNPMLNTTERLQLANDKLKEFGGVMNKVRESANELQPEGFSLEPVIKANGSMIGDGGKFADPLAGDDGSRASIAKINNQIRYELQKSGTERVQALADNIFQDMASKIPEGTEIPPELKALAQTSADKYAAEKWGIVKNLTSNNYSVPDSLPLTPEEIFDIYKHKVEPYAYKPNPAFPNQTVETNPGAVESLAAFSQHMNNMLDEVANKPGGENLKAIMMDAKKRYADLAPIQPLLQRAEITNINRPQFSIWDMGTAIGLGGGNAVKELSALGASMLYRRYGYKLTANTLYKVADLLDGLQSKAYQPIIDAIAEKASRAKTAAIPMSIHAMSRYYGSQ